ncbi:hypothetical protein [Flagellimonas sp. CMM7]|uniref:hypothetical protein n=1 Tax=Flagellimonas sp. CMM7 TaxID=2654676 RepID=UPI0013CFFBCC|nr:hypothetical protein [Flagellimonas sp. CMM7]UII79560.1 hypothetical protein LV704_18105 [Flagellimonas sp. CMM7]
MKSIHLTKHPSLLKDCFTIIKIHSDYWKVGENFNVYSYQGVKDYADDKLLTSVELVAKQTKRLEEINAWDSFYYNDFSPRILKEILRNRYENADLLLFDVLLFSNWSHSKKLLDVTPSYAHLFKDLRTPVKLSNHGK